MLSFLKCHKFKNIIYTLNKYHFGFSVKNMLFTSKDVFNVKLKTPSV